MVLTENEEEKHEYLEIIQKNSNLLLQLINDILDLSRIESGKSEMHFQQVEIAGLVDEVEKVHQLKMKLNVDLKVVRPQGEFWTSTDRNRVMQVLFNFLSNAIKNTETGSITLGLKQEGDWLKLFVSDTGCGIPEEKLPQIFTRFEKLNDFVQGTGLGLSICKSIVERLGGRIEVSSELGQGSTFALYLPYQEIPVEVAERSLSTKIDSESVRHKKILVVEDIESNFAQLNILLKKEYREDSNYFSFGSYYCSHCLCVLYGTATGYSGWMQCSYLQTIFFGETERNDRNLYRIINFLKGDQHSES